MLQKNLDYIWIIGTVGIIGVVTILALITLVVFSTERTPSHQNDTVYFSAFETNKLCDVLKFDKSSEFCTSSGNTMEDLESEILVTYPCSVARLVKAW